MSEKNAPDPARQAKALAIHARLCPIYGCPVPYFQSLDPLSELVSTYLNHRTRNRDAKRAFETLRARFPDWAAVRDAPSADVQAAIAGVRWPERKAPGLRTLLAEVERRVGRLALDHLADMPAHAARAWLEALPGVGPKTSAAVLSFSRLRGRALPVDSHHHRVAQRVGLIPARMDVGPSHGLLEGLLPDDWDAQSVYDHHQIFMRHGQRVCHWRKPDCGACAISDLCDHASKRVASASSRTADDGDAQASLW